MFNNLFCVLFKKNENEMKNELRKESEMNWKRKTKEIKIHKVFELCQAMGHLVVGRFKSKKNKKWKRKGKRERKKGSGVAEALGVGKSNNVVHLWLAVSTVKWAYFHAQFWEKVLVDTRNISTMAYFVFND